MASSYAVSLYGSLLLGPFEDPFPRQAPALTVYQVRILLACVLPKPTFDIPAAIRRVQYTKNEIMSLTSLIASQNWSNLLTCQPMLRSNTK